MKKFIIFVAIVVGGIFWLKDWITSGKMDQFIAQHKDPKITPQILCGISEVYFLAQEPKSAIRYYKWIVDEYPDYTSIAKIRWNLAECYEDTKQKDSAMEQYVILKDSFSATEYGQLALSKYQHLRF